MVGKVEATMPEDTPNLSPAQSPSEPSTPPEAPIPFNIGEDFGTARKNLPPAKIVLISVGAIALIAGVVALVQKPRQTATGSIDNIAMVELPGQNQVMAAIGISIHNGDKNSFVVHDIKADLEASNKSFSDEAASAVDFDRYFQAFPALKEHALDPLKLETRIEPGGDVKGTIIVSFPVAADAFTNRKSLTVTIWPAEQPIPLVLTK
jgi:hypothetical protein